MREREERILGDHMVLVGKEGDQLSLTEFKGGGGRATENWLPINYQ